MVNKTEKKILKAHRPNPYFQLAITSYICNEHGALDSVNHRRKQVLGISTVYFSHKV